MKKFTIKNFFFLLGLMLFVSGLNAQSTIYVKGDVMGGDGTSWGTAFQYLDDAVAAAADGDQIWVAAGTYIPGGAAPTRDTSFSLKDGVDVYGGFAGTETMLSERDFVTNATILSGDIDGDDGVNDFLSPARFANSKSVFVVDTSVQDAILDGFTISHGHTDTAALAADRRGGGMLIFGAPTIRNCNFESNYAGLGGAAYPRFANASGTTFEDCDFTNNASLNGGGAVYTAGANDLMFLNVTFSDNSSSGSGGGMLMNVGENVTFENCLFDGNFSGNNGGGALILGVLGLTINNTRYVQNTCNSGGAAMRLDECLFTMDQVTVDSNDAAGFGGGILILTSDFTISNSEISNNIGGTTNQAGGGMIVASFTGTTSNYLIENSTFAFNSAPFGGGFAVQSAGTVGIYDNVIFSGNSATVSGGCMSVAFDASVVILNSDMSNNNAQFGGAIQNQNSSDLEVYNTTFENNNSTALGGALILGADAFHVLDSCFFNGNVCTGGFGGAVSYQPDSFITNVIFIDQCHFQNNNGFDQGGAINISDGDVRITNSLFNFNKVTADPMSGAIAGRGGFLSNNCGVGDTSRVTLINNTIANSTGDFAAGISQWEADSTTATAEVVMANNVFFTPYGEDYAIEDGNPEVTSLGGNQADGAALAIYLTGTNDATGVADFGFVDEFGETDFNLLASSPLRDAAVEVTIPDFTPLTVDHNGNPRDAMPDIGAFEYQQGVGTRPEIGDANSLQLNPNPAVDYTTVTLTDDYSGEVTVRVSNILGQTISVAQHDKNTNEYQFELNTAQLTPGLYEVSLEFNNQVVTRKLIKRR